MAAARARDAGPRRGMTIPGSAVEATQYRYQRNNAFAAQVHELNERFRQAGVPLAYHNGFIQIVNDQQIEKQVAKPFWDVIADEKWKNVAVDMNEALDQRDGGGKDPALFAAKALESAIKIICTEKGWITGSEKGAANYIDNLGSKANGQFIAGWERDLLKEFFGKVRNELGHGPGCRPCRR